MPAPKFCTRPPLWRLLELLVHIKQDQIPDDYVWIKAEIPETLKIETADEIPKSPADYGTMWLNSTGRSAVLSVPSVIVPERNFLLNPRHSDFASIRWCLHQPLQVDPRLTTALSGLLHLAGGER